MFEKFTEKAIKVIMLAQKEARRLGHPFVGTEELLLGLIGESSGQAAIVLSQLGVTLRAAQREVEAVVGRGSDYVAIEIPFTERARAGLIFTLEIFRQMELQSIDTEHLLLGLLQVEDAVANIVLQNLGVDLAELRTRLLQASRDHSPTAPACPPEVNTTTAGPSFTSFTLRFTDPWETSY